MIRSTAFEAATFIKPPALPGVSDWQEHLAADTKNMLAWEERLKTLGAHIYRWLHR